MTLMRAKWLGLWAALLVLVGLLTPGLVVAQKKPGKKPDTKVKADDSDSKDDTAADVTDLGTAYQLVGYAEACKAPEALVTAGGLLKAVGRAELKELKAT